MRIFLILLTSVIFNACSPRLVSMPEPTQVHPTREIQSTPVATVSTEVDELVSIAVADLSSRLSLDPQVVRVFSTESHMWPDAALGCPRPGEVYAQKTVPGYRILLEVNGQAYFYHTDAEETVILCTEADLPSFPITPGDIDDGEPWMPVD